MNTKNSYLQENPFKIINPEKLSAKDTISLFVKDFTDIEKVMSDGNTFLVGSRGVGKSMIFRYLQFDCQCLNDECDLQKFDYISIYSQMKNSIFAIREMDILNSKNLQNILNEHWMLMYICSNLFYLLKNTEKIYNSISYNSIKEFYMEYFANVFDLKDNINLPNITSILEKMYNTVHKSYLDINNYIKKLFILQDNREMYDKPLLDYMTFFIPLIENLKNIKGFPQSSIYLLIDDAHYLTLSQTKILNTWIATRTNKNISIKVSSQYNYKTYYTLNNEIISSPHDYFEIDMNKIYTSNIDNYKKRIKSIIEKRLKLVGIETKVEDFFPCDQKQEDEIKSIADEYKKKYDNNEISSFNRSDAANRYARPDYIKRLSGSRKSSYNYSYSGFNQLVDLSSGIARFFIEPAFFMYAEEKENGNGNITFIKPNTQNKIIREQANKFFIDEFEKLKNDDKNDIIPKENIDKLYILLNGLGSLFRKILLSNRTERRIFSFAISDEISEEVNEVLNLGIELGYLIKSTIGRKESEIGGRIKRYIFNRRLAPIWTLDPTSISGCLFLKNKFIEDGLKDPKKLLYLYKIDNEEEQPELFDDSED